MILLIDADSLIFASNYRKREQPDDEPYYSTLAECMDKFDEQFMRIVNDLEEHYTIDEVITFNGSKGNFRKYVSKSYKANRNNIKLPPFLDEMHSYVKKAYNSVYGYGVETDDMVARYWNTLTEDFGRDEVMIVSIDKDYKQFPALIYNYHHKHRVVYDITKEEALFNFYSQMIEGDRVDNVNFFKGKGKSFAKKYFADCETEYQYIKKMFLLFKEKYKSKAREKYIECYLQLKLRTN